jgi:diacylglycerol O-acyltransferase / wax synthase
MRQLSGVDATFLHMENARTYGHTSGVIILDPSTADQPINADTIRDYIADRIHLLDPLRWRLVEVPLGIDRPYWVDDPDLDLNFHVRGIALPAPGSDQQLADQVARLAARHLDRAKPLWELYVIEGLEGGRVGIMTKLHHAAVDGKAGMQIMNTLLSTDPTCPAPSPAKGPTAEKVPSPLQMWGRGWMGVLAKPEHGVRLMLDLAKEGRKTAGQLGRGDLGDLKKALRNPGAAPRVSFNATVSAQRNWAFGSVALADVKAVKDAHQCTVNDVVMAMCAGALRRWLVDHEELPDKPLLAVVPISIRTAEQAATAGNQVSGMVSPLATNLSDPAERLKAASESMRAAKDQHAALPAHLLQDFSQFAAPAAAQLVADTAATLRWADRMTPPFNLAVSNVPGPREPLYYARALQEAHYPVSIATDGMGLNITLMSYRDRIDFGLVGTPELVPDIWNLIGYLQEELALLGKV